MESNILSQRQREMKHDRFWMEHHICHTKISYIYSFQINWQEDCDEIKFKKYAEPQKVLKDSKAGGTPK